MVIQGIKKTSSNPTVVRPTQRPRSTVALWPTVARCRAAATSSACAFNTMESSVAS